MKKIEGAMIGAVLAGGAVAVHESLSHEAAVETNLAAEHITLMDSFAMDAGPQQRAFRESALELKRSIENGGHKVDSMTIARRVFPNQGQWHAFSVGGPLSIETDWSGSVTIDLVIDGQEIHLEDMDIQGHGNLSTSQIDIDRVMNTMVESALMAAE